MVALDAQDAVRIRDPCSRIDSSRSTSLKHLKQASSYSQWSNLCDESQRCPIPSLEVFLVSRTAQDAMLLSTIRPTEVQLVYALR